MKTIVVEDTQRDEIAYSYFCIKLLNTCHIKTSYSVVWFTAALNFKSNIKELFFRNFL